MSRAADRERQQAAALDRRILELIAGARGSWTVDEAAFTRLALDIFAYQVTQQPAYRRYAAARGAVPGRLHDWRAIPPIPVQSFKTLRVASFPAAAAGRVFRSSGTSGRRRARVELDTLALYDAALLPTLRRYLLPDGARLAWVALLPDPAAATDSSLAYMVGRAAAACATRIEYRVEDGRLDLEGVAERLAAAARSGEPLCLLGTAFAFVHLVDHLAASDRRLALAPGSRLMETGGFKGRSRTVERSELYRQLAARLGVSPAAIVGEYGMTEMGSQFYDDALRTGLADPAAPRLKHGPPWVRTRVLDPVTLAPVTAGAPGVLAHLDLTGRGTALALLTEDLGRRAGGGFELLGRVAGAPLRGCSLPYEEMLRYTADS